MRALISLIITCMRRARGLDPSGYSYRSLPQRVRKGTIGPRIPSRADVKTVCRRLEAEYASPRHGNPVNPLDDLFYILLSNRTGAVVARRVFAKLKRRVRSWGTLRELSPTELRRILTPAGLVGKRRSQMLAIVRKLRQDFGRATLRPLSKWTDTAAEAYLISLSGVSQKVAKCVMLYGLNRNVLPVDVHVHRVTSRLGWHSHRRADQSHETLEKLVPGPLRYSFHVNCIAHGRTVCRAGLPSCGVCVVREHCHYFKSGCPCTGIRPFAQPERTPRVAEAGMQRDPRR